MHDVAKRAGVSQTAVSLVLNSPETSGIPEATQERIRQAVEDVGYRTNRLARAMRLDRTETIGFIADDIATTPYANLMIQGAQDAAWDAGHLLLIVNTGPIDHPNHHKLEADAIDQLLERQVDGVVLAAMFHREIRVPDALGDTRTVLLDAVDVEARAASVVPDEFDAAYRATSHLIEAGHTRIAHLTIAYPSVAPGARVDGYLAALATHGIDADDQLVVSVEATAAGGRVGTAELLNLDDPPTGIFCFNDQLAMGAYQTAATEGLRLPDDLSIVGFDDQQLIAAELMPALTTMRLPHYEMGRWAIEQVLRPGPDRPQHTLACDLVERDSVVGPRSGTLP